MDEITIKVNSLKNSLSRDESQDEYWDRIKIAVDEIKEGKGVVFTMEEFGCYLNAPIYPDKNIR